MQPLDFYALSRPAQERFVGSVTGSGLPAPILRTRTRPLAPFGWIAASAGSLVLAITLCRAGFGDLANGMAVQGRGFAIAYVGLIGLFVFGGLRALAILNEHKKSPFPRGVYVFPVGVIDARTSTLCLYPIEDLANVVGPDAKGFTLDFGSKSFAFAVTDEAVAATASRELASARGTIAEARGSRESIRPKALAALDPLQGYANPLGSSDPMVSTTPLWAKLAGAIAILAGVVVGFSVWIVRNAASDEALYAHAKATNDSASWSAYLAVGSRHKSEVSSVLLPRAQLLDAERAGTVAAIEQFIAAHPQTSISSEVEAAFKAALVSELDAATKVGTLAAIDDFTRRHPGAPVEAEVRHARHGVYAAAFTRYLAEAPPKASAETAFMQALLNWAETKGARVEIRFFRERSKTLEKADGAVAKHSMFKGAVSFPSRYFDGDGEKPYEDALVAATAQRFLKVFPAELVAMTAGEPIADPDAPLSSSIAVPTLFIEHGASWHGGVVTMKNPRGVYCGLEISFTALFRLPDTTKPVKIGLDGWHVPDTAAASDAEKPEEAIYGEMHTNAFDRFQKRLLGAFFK